MCASIELIHHVSLYSIAFASPAPMLIFSMMYPPLMLEPSPPKRMAPPPLPPLPAPPPRGQSLLELEEVVRIERATHPFGVLGDVLCDGPGGFPSDMRVAWLYEESLVRLQLDVTRRADRGLPPMDAARAAAAGPRLRICSRVTITAPRRTA